MKQLVMTKIEKTGSSTLCNIFGRFIMKKKLDIIIQKSNYHIDWFSPKGEGRRESAPPGV